MSGFNQNQMPNQGQQGNFNQPLMNQYSEPQQNYNQGYQGYQPPQQNFNQPYPPYQPPQNNVVVVQQQQTQQAQTPIIVINNQQSNDGYPKLSSGCAIVILILNIFFPGIGTIIMGCAGNTNTGSWICIGICQILLAVFLVGWIWAIVVGVNCMNRAGKN